MDNCTYKICIKCNTKKSCSEFVAYGTSTNGSRGYKRVCKKCANEASRLRKQLYKQNDKPINNECEICGSVDRKLVLDHCHSSKKFRGWLCNYCNVALGQLNDDVNILQKAINYLRKDDV